MPPKCYSMRVTRHQHHKQILFDDSLHNPNLENFQSAKYLGITITDSMDRVSTFQKTKGLGFPSQELGFFHLGVLRKLHIKLWFNINWSMQHPFGVLTRNFRLIRLRKFRGQRSAGPAGDGKTRVVSAKCCPEESPRTIHRPQRSFEHSSFSQNIVKSFLFVLFLLVFFRKIRTSWHNVQL